MDKFPEIYSICIKLNESKVKLDQKRELPLM